MHIAFLHFTDHAILSIEICAVLGEKTAITALS